MTATPSSCHHTDIEFSTVTRRTPAELSSPCTSRMHPKMVIVVPSVGVMPHCICAKAPTKVAAP